MLDIYPFIIDTLKLLAPIVRQIAKHDPDLARQMRRAGSSIALNTAEGMGSRGGNERARFDTALGSNQEVRGCLDVAEAWSYVASLLATDPSLRSGCGSTRSTRP